MTMYRLVMKPLLPGVVHCRPMVWVTKATKRKRPSTAPYSQSRRVVCRTVRGMTHREHDRRDDVPPQQVGHGAGVGDRVLDDDEVEAPDDGDAEERSRRRAATAARRDGDEQRRRPRRPCAPRRP